MKRVTYNFLTLVLAGSLMVSCGNNANREDKDTQEIAEDKNDAKFNDQEAEKTAQFLVDETNENYKDIEAAKVAVSRSNNAQVKEIANAIVTDHEANLAQLKQVATAKGVSIPTSPTEDALEESKKWNEVKADKFDKDFISKLAKDHKDDIQDLESKLNSTTDPDVRDYITNTLTKLRTHYDKIAALEATFK
ncbi:DUF4142 domain-containing protein [Gynurincola endophyticus]|jgi:putative membrane protein|uniref:DUF4142 domain-containing protein n=1 Tax=Gynurincola endophyticus TaxID=2479004 RepID=UPI000F8F33CF|nr:DUF4142 domain-containing protein [Gynurincola endophyticus]